MAMIEFVRNYSDRSTDKGYQFEFHCDHCGNGYVSSYQASLIGTAGSFLQAAGNMFGGILGSAGRSSYEIQRAIGGPAHDRALQEAVAEVKQKFEQCKRCGQWVCREICWNQTAAQCTGCTPKYEQEVISMRTQAQLQATQEQLQEKAKGTDYVSGISMGQDVQVQFSPGGHTFGLPGQSAAKPGEFLPSGWQGTEAAKGQTGVAGGAAWGDVGTPAAVGKNCASCGAALTGGRFCPGCGAATAPPVAKACGACGHVSGPAARFCEDCGGKLG